MSRGIKVYHLYRYRVAPHLTQETCARACGISATQYGRIERGRCDPTLSTVKKLVRVLRVSQKRLQTEDDDGYADVS